MDFFFSHPLGYTNQQETENAKYLGKLHRKRPQVLEKSI